MSKRSTYIASSIVGTLSTIIAGALGLPEMLTGELNNGFVNFSILLAVMILTVSMIVYFTQRKLARPELIRTILYASLWSIGTIAALIIGFFIAFAVKMNNSHWSFG